MRLSEILEYRMIEQRKIYYIENSNEHYIVKGSYIRKMNISEATSIIDIFFSFQKDDVSWHFLEKRINNDFDNNYERWQSLNSFSDEKDIEFDNIYADGIKIF